MADIESFFASVRLPSINHVTHALIRMLDNEAAGLNAFGFHDCRHFFIVSNP